MVIPALRQEILWLALFYNNLPFLSAFTVLLVMRERIMDDTETTKGDNFHLAADLAALGLNVATGQVVGSLIAGSQALGTLYQRNHKEEIGATYVPLSESTEEEKEKAAEHLGATYDPESGALKFNDDDSLDNMAFDGRNDPFRWDDESAISLGHRVHEAGMSDLSERRE